ncbi:MAG TPA: hypothetical protein VGK16_03885 [Candidatus Limnocylindrales bacterium]|jgi:hypothetical protein
MENRSRTIVIVLIAVFALLGGFAAGALLTGGKGSGTASPSAEARATDIPTDEASAEPSAEAPSDEPSPSDEASPSDAPSPSGAPAAEMTISALFLDAKDNPDGADRVITWKSATGSVRAQVKTVSPMGDVVMCLKTPTKTLGCRTAASGTLKATTTKPSETFILTLRGDAIAQPVVDVTLSFLATKPKVTIDNARFDGTAYPDTNGIQAIVTPRVDGKLGVTAQWGGHPFTYEIDVIEQGGAGSLTYAPDQGSVGTDVDFAVTAGKPWKVVLQNTEDGFGITPMQAVISWP